MSDIPIYIAVAAIVVAVVEAFFIAHHRIEIAYLRSVRRIDAEFIAAIRKSHDELVEKQLALIWRLQRYDHRKETSREK